MYVKVCNIIEAPVEENRGQTYREYCTSVIFQKGRSGRV